MNESEPYKMVITIRMMNNEPERTYLINTTKSVMAVWKLLGKLGFRL